MKWLFCLMFLFIRSVLSKQKIETEIVRAGYYVCGSFVFDSPNLTLSCGTVSTSGHSKPPRVEWFFLGKNSTIIPLNDSDYWFQEHQKTLCKYGGGYYRQFAGPSSFDCSLKEKLRNFTNVYECNYSHADIIPMKYRCKISTYQGGKRYEPHKIKDITLKANKNNPRFYCSEGVHICFMPSPQNLTLLFVGKSLINVTWQISERKSFSGCTRPFCNGARRFQVQLLIFNSVPYRNQEAPLLKTSWLKTAKRRKTFLEFENSLATEERYYQFYVKNMNKIPQRSRDPDNGDIKITDSGICHLGIQRAAVLEVPSSDVEYNTSFENYVNITCRASGSPPPTVEFFYESQDGRNVTLQQGSLEIYRFHFVYMLQPQVIYCRGSNVIVQPTPCGELVYTEEVHKITINAV